MFKGCNADIANAAINHRFLRLSAENERYLVTVHATILRNQRN